MVLPFALAHDDCYYYFIVFFLCAALSCFTPQCGKVVLSMSGWIVPCHLFLASMLATMAMETTAQLRRQWDPCIFAPMVLYFLLTSPRHVWEPGILLASMALPLTTTSPRHRPPALLHASIGSMRSLKPLSLSPTMIGSSSSRPTPTQPIALFIATDMRPRPPTARNARIVSGYYPTTNHSFATSIFHYCHPVLSRPTVPNIDTAFCSRVDTVLLAVQELPPCLPFGVCCCFCLPVSYHIMGPCCVPSDRLRNNRCLPNH